MDIELLKTIGQWGAWAIVFTAFVWLVREVIFKMGATMSVMSDNMKVISANMLSLQSRIEFWNKDSETAHSFQREEHKDMMDVLNGLKPR